MDLRETPASVALRNLNARITALEHQERQQLIGRVESLERYRALWMQHQERITYHCGAMGRVLGKINDMQNGTNAHFACRQEWTEQELKCLETIDPLPSSDPRAGVTCWTIRPVVATPIAAPVGTTPRPPGLAGPMPQVAPPLEEDIITLFSEGECFGPLHEEEGQAGHSPDLVAFYDQLCADAATLLHGQKQQ